MNAVTPKVIHSSTADYQPVSNAIKTLWHRHELVTQLTLHSIRCRYRGNIAGLSWSFIEPILMLCIYTFVFTTVFKARWGTSLEQDTVDFALILFVGISVHGLLSEVVSRATTLVTNNQNFVKKVIFPLEVLPHVSLLSAGFHMLMNFAVLLIALLITKQTLHLTVLLAPVIILPYAMILLGFGYVLAALGVFFKDISQITGTITMLSLFGSTVFFPISALPPRYRLLIRLNPVTEAVEQLRGVLIWGHLPDWYNLSIYYLVAVGSAWFGLMFFQMTRREEFANVL